MAGANHHLVWVWQFSTDGEPDVVGARLRDHGLGIIHKTHDGVSWMSRYDKSSYAVDGPRQIEVLARYFEDAGVPFHAWCVVHGTDPKREAEMAAEALNAGARSLYLDIEPYAGFWRGSPADAVQYGEELRRLAPDAKVVLSIDPRPWAVEKTPMAEFVSFCNAIAPQNYWRTFDTSGNVRRFTESGFKPPEQGITPEFLQTVADSVLTPFGLPILEVGQGDTQDGGEWQRYIDGAFERGADYVTVWRYGTTREPVFTTLRDKPAKQPPVAPPMATHVVQSGETLGGIAALYGTTTDAIVEINSLSDPDYLYVGQELLIPGAAVVQPDAVSAQPVAGGSSVHTVVSGDTIHAIAVQYDSSVEEIVALNGLSDPDFIYVGQSLQIP